MGRPSKLRLSGMTFTRAIAVSYGLALLTVLTSAASSAGPQATVSLCGPKTCSPSTDAVVDKFIEQVLKQQSSPIPPSFAPYFVLRVSEPQGVSTVFWVPHSKTLRTDLGWTPATASLSSRLNRAFAVVGDPYSPIPSQLEVNGHVITDPAMIKGLVGDLSPWTGGGVPIKGAGLSFDLGSKTPNPWFQPTQLVTLYRDSGILNIGGSKYRISPSAVRNFLSFQKTSQSPTTSTGTTTTATTGVAMPIPIPATATNATTTQTPKQPAASARTGGSTMHDLGVALIAFGGVMLAVTTGLLIAGMKHLRALRRLVDQ